MRSYCVQVNYGIAGDASIATHMYDAIDAELSSRFQLRLPQRAAATAHGAPHDAAAVTRKLDHAIQIAPVQPPRPPALPQDDVKEEKQVAAAMAAAQSAEEEALRCVSTMQIVTVYVLYGSASLISHHHMPR